MDINYDVTVDDMVKFNAHHLRSSGASRSSLARTQAGIAAIYAMLTTMIVLTGDIPLYLAAVPMALLTAVVVGRLPGRVEQRVRRLVQASYAEGRNLGTLGPHRLTLTGDGFIDASPYVESRVRWEAVERVEITDEHAFVYIGSLRACVIPRRAFPDEATFYRFVETVRHLARRLPPPAPTPSLGPGGPHEPQR